MKRRGGWIVFLIAAAVVLSAVSLLVGCSGSSTAIPKVITTVSVDGRARQVTVDIKGGGGENSLVAVILVFPDGQQYPVYTSNMGGNDSGSVTVDQSPSGGNGMPSGSYTCMVYQIPAKPQDPTIFPRGQMVDANLVCSTSFVLP